MSALKKVKLGKTSSRNNLKALRSPRVLNKNRSPKTSKKMPALPRLSSEIDHIFDEVELRAMARKKLKRNNSKDKRFSLTEFGPIGMEIS